MIRIKNYLAHYQLIINEVLPMLLYSTDFLFPRFNSVFHLSLNPPKLKVKLNLIFQLIRRVLDNNMMTV